MATERELAARRDAELAARHEARREAARAAGNVEWALLPDSVEKARRRSKSYAFTGRRCERGHFARIIVHSGRCERCVDGDDTSLEEQLWADRFARLADAMEQTGRLHYLKRDGQSFRLVSTDRVIRFQNVREACEKAAKLTARDGELRCVVPGATRMVVRHLN